MMYEVGGEGASEKAINFLFGRSRIMLKLVSSKSVSVKLTDYVLSLSFFLLLAISALKRANERMGRDWQSRWS